MVDLGCWVTGTSGSLNPLHGRHASFIKLLLKLLASCLLPSRAAPQSCNFVTKNASFSFPVWFEHTLNLPWQFLSVFFLFRIYFKFSSKQNLDSPSIKHPSVLGQLASMGMDEGSCSVTRIVLVPLSEIGRPVFTCVFNSCISGWSCDQPIFLILLSPKLALPHIFMCLLPSANESLVHLKNTCTFPLFHPPISVYHSNSQYFNPSHMIVWSCWILAIPLYFIASWNLMIILQRLLYHFLQWNCKIKYILKCAALLPSQHYWWPYNYQ